LPTVDDILGPDGAALWRAVAAWVARGVDAPLPPDEREALGLRLVAWQRSRCPAVDRVIRAFAGDAPLRDLDRVPGVPTDAFKRARVACFDETHTARTFLTSGTTVGGGEQRGRHELFDTSLYRASALATARRWLLPAPPYRFVLLAEPEAEAPHSSLGFMLARLAEDLGDGRPPWMVRGGRLDVDGVSAALREAAREGAPVALLGASFGFVHLLDALDGAVPACAPGSVVLATGGFKGRSREVAPEVLFAEICARFGLTRTDVVQEYGMTELSSQAWEDHALGVGRYVAPPWVTVRAVDPATLEPRAPGEDGILRVLDLTNVGSCAVIQTSDLGRVHADGSFEVHGRAPGATPRGCARALDALLS
jgi:hypothetical protein